MKNMKVHTEYLTFNTRDRYEMVHITPQIEAIVRKSGVDDGLCFVSPMHITAAIYVNDNESGLIEDIGKWLEELAPRRPNYKHHQTGEDNADAHLKALLLHHETTLPVTHGRLDLGTWQRIFYAEFDGQRPSASSSRSWAKQRIKQSALLAGRADPHEPIDYFNLIPRTSSAPTTSELSSANFPAAARASGEP